MSEASGDTESCHSPEQGMKCARLLGKEVPCRVMSSSCLRYLTVRPWLDRVDEIWKPNSILDEEHGNIISHNVLGVYVSVD